MYYESNAECAGPHWGGAVHERRSRYRRNWYAEREAADGTHPATAEAERRVRRGGGKRRFARILALNERLATAGLPPEVRADWLRLEEALHAHWLAVAIEHYNLGVEAGLLQARIEPAAFERLPARQRLHNLAEALQRALADLD